MAFLRKIVPIAMFLFVVSSMLAVGLGLTISEIFAPLRNVKLVVLALIANFVLMPLAAILISRMLQLDQPLGVGSYCWELRPALRFFLNWPGLQKVMLLSQSV